MDDQGFRAWARARLGEAGLPVDDETSRWCDRRLYYHSIGAGTKADYRVAAARIESIEKERDLPGNRVFYLALPADVVPNAIANAGQVGLNRSPGWTRIVMEKPFGRDLASAQQLNLDVHRYFDESQIYRIDHFLGKETVQNLLVFRFGNVFFEKIWNRENVESVEITVAEDVGVEKRTGYYEHAGALRDMIQNHLTQLLTLVAMEVPAAFEASAIRTEKLKVLQQIPPLRFSGDVVFGQYARGQMAGQEVASYREEPGIAPDSNTETFAALRVEVASWRWKGVPFYLRTGKRMAMRCSQIVLQFHCAPVSIFRPFEASCGVKPNMLVITIQPNEGFDLHFQAKAPGQAVTLTTQPLRFRYSDVFGPLTDAYETLLLDVVTGDQTLFVCDSEVEASWRFYDPLLTEAIPVYPYAAGSWGPEEMNRLPAPWLNWVV
jgi:glucose-6-phosphate 1-dehydrogenase